MELGSASRSPSSWSRGCRGRATHSSALCFPLSTQQSPASRLPSASRARPRICQPHLETNTYGPSGPDAPVSCEDCRVRLIVRLRRACRSLLGWGSGRGHPARGSLCWLLTGHQPGVPSEVSFWPQDSMIRPLVLAIPWTRAHGGPWGPLGPPHPYRFALLYCFVLDLLAASASLFCLPA